MIKNGIHFFLKFLFILIFLGVLCICSAQNYNGQFNSMLTQINELNSIESVLLINERISGVMIKSKGYAKVNYFPYKVYFYQIFPNNGLELILNENLYGKKAIVNTNTFPYINLHLTPFHSLMRKEKHHTLYEGEVFKYMGGLLEDILKNNSENITIIDSGLVKINNQLCKKIILTINNFSFTDYEVQEAENVYDIAIKMKVNDYMILSLNKGINDYDDVISGDIIKIPTYYAKEFHFYIDENLNLPIYIKIFDHKGLYEEYYFSDLKINIEYPDIEFTKEFEGYSF